jgi:hypothetical protein
MEVGLLRHFNWLYLRVADLRGDVADLKQWLGVAWYASKPPGVVAPDRAVRVHDVGGDRTRDGITLQVSALPHG